MNLDIILLFIGFSNLYLLFIRFIVNDMIIYPLKKWDYLFLKYHLKTFGWVLIGYYSIVKEKW